MDALSLQEVCQVVAGRWLTPPSDTLIKAVCTDSKHMQGESIFVALKGEKFDGHRFLNQAAQGGAVAALVQEEPGPTQASVGAMALIGVPDTRAALGKLAHLVRQKFRGKVVAVAGSNGKTSTKHLIHAALGSSLRGTISPKSYNNDIGVPLTIFPADASQDYLVLEMGTNHPGEIRTLTHMAKPDAVVLTNASAEHLEFLGDLAGVRRENASIIEGLNPTGLLAVNGDDPELIEAVCAFKGTWTSFGFGGHNNLFATHIRVEDQGTRFRLNGQSEVFVPLLGKHTAINALAAIAVGRWMGLSQAKILSGLAHSSGPEMRLQLHRMGAVRLLNDAYNANPASMKAALETLRELPTQGRRIAVVGDMRELGESGPRCHEEVGEFAAGCNLDQLICIGPQAQLIAGVARRLGMAAERITMFPDAQAAAQALPPRLADGDLVLLKASRTMHLEVVADAIRKKF